MSILSKRALKIFVFLFLVLMTDLVLGLILEKLYFRQKAGNNYSLTYALEKCKSDIFIMGASQAQHNYDPRIISDSLKMRCYNAGQDGGHSILLPYAMVKIILARHTPKIIMIEINSLQTLNYNEKDYEKLAILEPYYSKYPELKDLILLRGPSEKFKLLSRIYPYNSKIINLIRFNTNIDKTRQWMFNGYIPVKKVSMDVTKIHKHVDQIKNVEIDTNKILAVNEIINLCKIKNVKLYFIISPAYQADNKQEQKISKSQKKLMEITINENIPLIDMSQLKYFQDNPSLFVDPMHLTEMGSQKYSSLVSDIIKKMGSSKKGNIYPSKFTKTSF